MCCLLSTGEKKERKENMTGKLIVFHRPSCDTVSPLTLLCVKSEPVEEVVNLFYLSSCGSGSRGHCLGAWHSFLVMFSHFYLACISNYSERVQALERHFCDFCVWISLFTRHTIL